MFKHPGDLASLYDEIVRTAIFTAKPDMYGKFGHVLRIESTCNDIGTFRVKRKVEHRDGSLSEQKAPLKKSIYSLYQLFTIMKAANYRYLEFISSFDDHSKGNGNSLQNVICGYLKPSAVGNTWLLECGEKISAHIWEISVSLPCQEYLNGSAFMGSSSE